jgi:hypothetical protein
MKQAKLFSLIFFFSFSLVGCYTIISHPVVKKDNSYNRVKFYNDCLSCHSRSELVEYGQIYLNPPQQVLIVNPSPIWISPIYVSPWWADIRMPVVPENNYRPNDETKLRNLDGGRTSAPTNFSQPSRSQGSSSSSSSSSNSATNNSANSSTEKKSRERDSDTPKSRENTGERKK